MFAVSYVFQSMIRPMLGAAIHISLVDELVELFLGLCSRPVINAERFSWLRKSKVDLTGTITSRTSQT